MNAQNPIFLIESNDFAAKHVRQILGVYGFDEFVQVVSNAPDGEDSAVIELSKPIRVGHVIDQITRLLAKSDSDDGVMEIGQGYVDVKMANYYADNEATPVRLTEKEVALIVLLNGAEGEIVTRESLLEDVWQYAEGVETHTLETHIYRLRQKIEEDPANPKLLMTGEAGYFLSLEIV